MRTYIIHASRIVLFGAVFLLLNPVQAQSYRYTRKISWHETTPAEREKNRLIPRLVSEDIVYRPFDGKVYPYFNEKFALPEGTLSAGINQAVYEPVTDASLAAYFTRAGAVITPVTENVYERGEHKAAVHFMPLRLNQGKLERLVSFELELKVSPSALSKKGLNKTTNWAASSVLSQGEWYKFSLGATGIYKIDYNTLKDVLKIPVESIDPHTLKIYSHGGGPLPPANAVDRPGDLPELAIKVVGENDNKLDPGDYILFYATGPVKWRYDAASGMFRHINNYYADLAFYFLTYGGANGKRIVTFGSGQALTENKTVNSFDDYVSHEAELNNFAQSGCDWWGEEFGDFQLTRSFTHNFPGMVSGDSCKLFSSLGAHSGEYTNFRINFNGTVKDRGLNASGLDYENDYLYEDSLLFHNTATGSSAMVSYTYQKSWVSSKGYLNYYDLNVRRSLAMHTGQIAFRDAKSLGGIARFDLNVSGSPNTEIWDVTNLHNVVQQLTYDNGTNTLSFKSITNNLHEYVAFNGTDFQVPHYEGKVANQNLHAQQPVDFIIITHPDFRSEADRLADYHRTKDGMSVLVVDPQTIYNEFSTGVQDVVAIRDFMKMLYDKTGGTGAPKYLLMMGKASYDYKNRIKGNTNFVPTYQTPNSYYFNGTYCSDDYFVLLDNNEGDWENGPYNQSLDIAVARMPVSKPEEARVVVDKALNYHTSQSMGDWRNVLTFVADDLDEGWSTGHLEDAEYMVKFVDTIHRNYNIDKIYCDAYRKVSEGQGKTFPDVSAAIDRSMEKGTLIMNYNGHGGEGGWAHERILVIPSIQGWSNKNRLTLMVTATCEFSRFDDPERVSAGEYVFTNANGGSIAMFTTTRVVYQAGNRELNSKLYDNNVFVLHNGKVPTMGDVYRRMKNNYLDFNSRNFTMFGDPALQLAYPKYKVATTSVNGKPVSVADTLRALTKVTITGEVTDAGGNKLTGFNGTIYPTVYDKPKLLKTILNEPWSKEYNFSLQKNILYKGEASVVNGEFSFTFIMPKDIDYKFGKGKISYYAKNGTEDAAGNFTNVYIGGSVDTAAIDQEPPRVELFMNDDKFVFGGTTNQSPSIYAKVFDENGINTAGNGIGHEITATLDAGTPDKKLFVLNDFYKAKKDSYKEGEILYPLEGLKEGKHTLSLKVWDVYNNSAEAYTEFVVASDARTALDHVLNYPNPFTTNTTFHFDHNKPGQNMKVQVQIMSVSGKVIKTINRDVTGARSHIDEISWDGLDEYGDKIGRGVYLYKVSIRTQDGSSAEKIEKLVILN